MAKRVYGVSVPVAGHCYIEVEADTEDEAVELAINTVTVEHLETWESLARFNQGNVCYCPHPWEAEATDLGDADDDDDDDAPVTADKE